jgi:UDPglucose 6-dehydrogenase
MTHKMKLGWIGLGKCGLPIAQKIAETCDVAGYDRLIKDVPFFTPNITDLMDTSITFVLVETPHANPNLDGSVPINLNSVEDFDYTALDSVLTTLSEQHYRGIVVVSSTVSPGTTQKMADKFDDLIIVYMPVMIHIGSVANDFVTAPVYFIGSNSPEASKQVANSISQFVNGEIRHGTYEEVELYKMFGNIFTSLKIGFVNTISEMIEHGDFNASSWNVMGALLDEKQNFNTTRYLTPGSGNGGPCHPRDGVVLSWLTGHVGMQSHLMTDITQARQDQAYAIAKYLVGYNLPIVILGKSFKIGVDLTVGSYSVLVGEYCKQLGVEVQYDCASIVPSVVLIAHPNSSLLDTYPSAEGSKIVDLWNLGLPDAKVWGDNLKT